MQEHLHITAAAATVAPVPSLYLKEVPSGFSQERPYSGFARRKRTRCAKTDLHVMT